MSQHDSTPYDSTQHDSVQQDSMHHDSVHHDSVQQDSTGQGFDAWNYREGTDLSTRQDDLAGFTVHATDGHIGKIDGATREVDASYVVVDTGPWIFGRKVLLPAGTIERVDWDEKDVYVDRTKDEIKDSPELRDEDRLDGSDTAVNDEYRGRLSDYYGERPGGPGDGARV